MARQRCVIIDGRHSLNDLNLILTSMKIGIPEPKTSYIDVPGRNGRIDVTEYVLDAPVFDNRKLEFKFTFNRKVDKESWEVWKSRILNHIHGKKVQIVLDNTPSWYYLGRVAIEAEEDEGIIMSVIIKAEADPFQYSYIASEKGGNWKWDELNFIDGVIYAHSFMAPEGTTVIRIPNCSMSVVPTIRADKAVTITYNGRTYSIAANKEVTDPTIVLRYGLNEMRITAAAETKVNVDFNVGKL